MSWFRRTPTLKADWNSDHIQFPGEGETFDRYTQNAKFENYVQWRTNRTKIRIEGKSFEKDFSNFPFHSIAFVNCRFTKCEFTETGLQHAIFDACTFEQCRFGGRLDAVRFGNCHFSNCNFQSMNSVELISCNVDHSSFEPGYTFTGCKIISSRILDLDLRGIEFRECSLAGTIFLDVIFDESTRFLRLTSTVGLTVNRLALAHLDPKDFGGLTPGQRTDMRILDDVGQMRLAFGGFKFWFYLAAVTWFFSPYVLFTLTRFLDSQMRTSETSISLGIAIWNYFLTGGAAWKTGTPVDALSLTTGILFLVWNVARILLLVKTMNLELQEKVKGVPARFELAADLRSATSWRQFWWTGLYRFNYLMFWFGVVIAIVHGLIFLQTPVPA
jgi:uncharacterized protein YjbI with pentapeptide repeats